MDMDSNTTSLTPRRQGQIADINPTKPSAGESLPEGFARSYAGFLIRTSRKRIHVSEELVAAEESFLQDHLIVVSFLRGRPNSTGFNTWLTQLNRGISGGSLSFSGDLGWGFTCLKASTKDVARQALVLTPCRIGSFLSIFQQWTPSFDPATSRGMLVPTWITLRRLPLQFFGVAQEIAATLGKVLGKDGQNSYFKDPRFCIALDTSQGWETEIEIENRLTGRLTTILVDYANLPIRCRYCCDLHHQVNVCPQRSGSVKHPNLAARNQAPQAPSDAPQRPNRPTVDEDGFTSTSRQ